MKNSEYWGSWKKGPNTTVEEVGRVGCCIVYVGLQTKSVVLGKRLKGAYTTLWEEEGGGEILGISTREKTWDKKMGMERREEERTVVAMQLAPKTT